MTFDHVDIVLLKLSLQTRYSGHCDNRGLAGQASYRTQMCFRVVVVTSVTLPYPILPHATPANALRTASPTKPVPKKEGMKQSTRRMQKIIARPLSTT
jgi:hypothetical protein